MNKNQVDILENRLLKLDKSGELFSVLLLDMTLSTDMDGKLRATKQHKNIIWGTSNYKGHQKTDQMKIEHITGKNGKVIMPRVEKNKQIQKERTKTHAEVFTPSWVVEKQNNLVDEAWFFDKDILKRKTSTEFDFKKQINKLKSENLLQEYLERTELEITCGEAPYICSRYDAVSGEVVQPKNRVGFLDRKLQVLNKFFESEIHQKDQQKRWLNQAKAALKSCYGFDFQGDNVLLARENLLETVRDFYQEMFKKELTDTKNLNEIAKIISWNIFQMDGLKYIIPFTQKREKVKETGIQGMLFELDVLPTVPEKKQKEQWKTTPGQKVKIMNWKKNKIEYFEN